MDSDLIHSVKLPSFAGVTIHDILEVMGGKLARFYPLFHGDGRWDLHHLVDVRTGETLIGFGGLSKRERRWSRLRFFLLDLCHRVGRNPGGFGFAESHLLIKSRNNDRSIFAVLVNAGDFKLHGIPFRIGRFKQSGI